MQMVVIHGGRQLSAEHGNALLMDVSRKLAAKHAASRMGKRHARVETLPLERRSVERAMLTVEEAFVRAMWVLQRTEGGDGPIAYASSNGVNYTVETLDRYAEALAHGGWKTPAPRPAAPSSKEITAAEQAQLWVCGLDPIEARVLTVGAMSKRGDAGRRVNWMRVRSRLPELAHYSVRSLQGIYTDALRSIVSTLVVRRIQA